MMTFFHSIIDRLKVLVVTTVALDFEALVVAGQAKRKANLLQQAERYESDGLVPVAKDLRT